MSEWVDVVGPRTVTGGYVLCSRWRRGLEEEEVGVAAEEVAVELSWMCQQTATGSRSHNIISVKLLLGVGLATSLLSLSRHISVAIQTVARDSASNTIFWGIRPNTTADSRWGVVNQPANRLATSTNDPRAVDCIVESWIFIAELTRLQRAHCVVCLSVLCLAVFTWRIWRVS